MEHSIDYLASLDARESLLTPHPPHYSHVEMSSSNFGPYESHHIAGHFVSSEYHDEAQSESTIGLASNNSPDTQADGRLYHQAVTMLFNYTKGYHHPKDLTPLSASGSSCMGIIPGSEHSTEGIPRGTSLHHKGWEPQYNNTASKGPSLRVAGRRLEDPKLIEQYTFVKNLREQKISWNSIQKIFQRKYNEHATAACLQMRQMRMHRKLSQGLDKHNVQIL
ncbi:hypothetical protein BDV12DRAFT_181792 [Aspergillus spectabilis]